MASIDYKFKISGPDYRKTLKHMGNLKDALNSEATSKTVFDEFQNVTEKSGLRGKISKRGGKMIFTARSRRMNARKFIEDTKTEVIDTLRRHYDDDIKRAMR